MSEEFDFEKLDRPSGRSHQEPAFRAAESSPRNDDEFHVLEYVRRLYKHRWVAVGILVVVLGAALAETANPVPLYEAHAKMLIEAQAPRIVDFSAPTMPQVSSEEFYQTQYRLLQSRTLARRALTSTPELLAHPEFGGSGPGVTAARRFRLSRVFKDTMRWLRPSPDDEGDEDAAPLPAELKEAEAARLTRAIDALLGSLTVTQVRGSRLVDIAYESPDRALAPKVANAITKAYIEQNYENRFLASKEASEWLGARLAEQRKEVQGAENTLQQYREQNASVSLDDRQNIVMQRLADLSAAVTRAKTERIEKEALYNQLNAAMSDRSSLDSFPAVLSNPFLQQLKADLLAAQQKHNRIAETFGEKHPDFISSRNAVTQAESKLQAESLKVVRAVHSDFLAAQAQERNLSDALEAQKRDALNLNRKAIEFGALQRDASSNQQVFENLLQRAKEIGIAGDLRNMEIRIVDAAETPRGPQSTHRGRTLLFALLGGFGLAIGVAFFLEYLDNRIKTPEEIKSYLNLPSLGLIPALPRNMVNTNGLISGSAPAGFIEAFRSLRTNVLFSGVGGTAHSLVVTSSTPAEGKTMVSSNLAIALAEAGQRVLLIDADMRRPRVHELFNVQREPGLSNLIVGNARASETVRRSEVPGLWLLPAGHPAPNPAELLGMQRFKDFIATLDNHFDWVIIDTPPVMPVTDAAVISHYTAGVLLCVGSEMTSRGVVQASLEQLANARARVIGAVLNKVDLERQPFYYAKYYRPEYAGYQTGRSVPASRTEPAA